MTKIYFVRHAQPDYSYGCDPDLPLTEQGRRDCDAVFDFLRGKHIDVFYSSPYKRCVDTLARSAEYIGKSIITDFRLREREKGEDSMASVMLEKRWADFTYTEQGGEPLAEVQKRNVEAVHEILRDNPGKTVVVGTHGTSFATLMNYFEPSLGYGYFIRITGWKPFVIELDFEGEALVGSCEWSHISR